MNFQKIIFETLEKSWNNVTKDVRVRTNYVKLGVRKNIGTDPEKRGDYFRMTVERGDRKWCLPSVVAARGLRPGRMEHF